MYFYFSLLIEIATPIKINSPEKFKKNVISKQNLNKPSDWDIGPLAAVAT